MKTAPLIRPSDTFSPLRGAKDLKRETLAPAAAGRGWSRRAGPGEG
jgi:hypothetical protein